MAQQTEQFLRIGQISPGPADEGGGSRLRTELLPPDEGRIILHDFEHPSEQDLAIRSLKLLFPEHLVQEPATSESAKPSTIRLLDLITPQEAPHNHLFKVNEDVIAVQTTNEGAVSFVRNRDLLYGLYIPVVPAL